MAARIEGKIALVTGGGSGIGQATALAFAREGAKVVVADVLVEGGEDTVTRIKTAGGEALFVKTDVAQVAEVEALVKRTVDTYGQLDCALNNAGIAGAVAKTADYTQRAEAVVWLCSDAASFVTGLPMAVDGGWIAQ